MIYPKIKLKMIDYLHEILYPICVVFIVSFAICIITSKLFEVYNFWTLLEAVVIYEGIILGVVFLLGLQRSEKQFAIQYLRKIIN